MQCLEIKESTWDIENEFLQVRDKISVFGGLTQEQILTIAPFFKKKKVKQGDIIFNQGGLPCNVYILLRGSVIMEIYCEDGKRKQVEYVEGDCFGETAVMGIQPQLGHSIASSDCTLLVLSRSGIFEIAELDNTIFTLFLMNITREVSRRLHSFINSSSNLKINRI